MATIESIQAQIDSIISTLKDPSEYEIDGAIKIKNKVSDKIMALNALQLQLDLLNEDGSSPTIQGSTYGYESI